MNRRQFIKTEIALAASMFFKNDIFAGGFQPELTPYFPWQLAATFSICAVDPETGEAGVAVASHCLSVGALVPYAEPGVGAIATQAYVNPEYGSKGLEYLRQGKSAAETLALLTKADITVTPDKPEIKKKYTAEQMTKEGTDFTIDKKTGSITWFTSRIRQAGIVDAKGTVATHTGACTFPWNGSVTGQSYTCQGNLLAGERVVKAMAETFEKEREKTPQLVKPLFAALEAGDINGGDKRGKMAAGILAVRKGAHWSGNDRYCDVRVDFHTEPVKELGRILKTNKII